MMLGEQICRRFSFAEIQSATHNFDDASIIGQGGFGKVYKGVIDDGATTVAVKRSNPMSKQGANEFRTEIDMLSKFRHCHLVSLIGYCDDSDEMILVYEYMIRGTLGDHLHKKVGKDGNSPPSWVRRLKICIGAARGLDYLHTGTGVLHTVIHRDVKSSNILIDENWAAKISDFGLSKIGSTNQGLTDVNTVVKGTFGYLDPEYLLTLRLTRKSDVYSFGVVLMEVLCGRPALEPRFQWEQRNLARWAQHCIKEKRVSQIIDPNLEYEIFPNSLTTFVELADQCLHNYPKKRPTMSSIVTRLEQALAFQERPDSSSIIEMELFNVGCAYTEEESEDDGQHDATISLDNESKEQVYNQLELKHDGNVGQNDAISSLDDKSEEQAYNQLEVIHGDNGGNEDEPIKKTLLDLPLDGKSPYLRQLWQKYSFPGCTRMEGSSGARVWTMSNGGEEGYFRLSPSSVMKIQKGDITQWFVDGCSDSIVNPTNERMLGSGGGGADGAIHSAAGPELLSACYNVPEFLPGVRCPTGKAKITPGFRLPASHVIHTVGPIYGLHGNPGAYLRSAYRNSLRVARDNNIQYVAFPAISCGTYGYPYDEAATVAISAIRDFANDIKEVHFVLFLDDIYNVWLKKSDELLQN